MINPSAAVVVMTQYNPYKNFAGNALYTGLNAAVETAVTYLRQAVVQYASAGGYLVADVYSSFAADSTTELCFASMNPLQLDFHPTPAGHQLIADTFYSVIESHLLADVSFTEQPQDITVTAGSITGSLTAKVEAGSSVPDLYWYASDAEGNIIGDPLGNGDSFAIPEDLTEGTYYYVCQAVLEEADSVVDSRAAAVMVNAAAVEETTDKEDEGGLSDAVSTEISKTAQTTTVSTSPGTGIHNEYGAMILVFSALAAAAVVTIVVVKRRQA